MLTISLGHKLFHVNQICYFAIIVYDTENAMGFWHNVLQPCDNCSHRQFYIVEIVYNFSMIRAVHAIKIACDNRTIFFLMLYLFIHLCYISCLQTLTNHP